MDLRGALRYLGVPFTEAGLCLREDLEPKNGKIPLGMDLIIQVRKMEEQRETSEFLQSSL